MSACEHSRTDMVPGHEISRWALTGPSPVVNTGSELLSCHLVTSHRLTGVVYVLAQPSPRCPRATLSITSGGRPWSRGPRRLQIRPIQACTPDFGNRSMVLSHTLRRTLRSAPVLMCRCSNHRDGRPSARISYGLYAGTTAEQYESMQRSYSYTVT